MLSNETLWKLNGMGNGGSLVAGVGDCGDWVDKLSKLEMILM